jgi:ABC-type transport system substrate-binding protein
MAAAGFEGGIDLEMFVPVSPNGAQPWPDELTLTRDAFNNSGLFRIKETQVPNNAMTPYYQTNEYTGFIGPVVASGGSPDTHMARFYHETQATHAFRGDPKMMDILARYRQEFDYEARIEILHEFQRYAGEVFYHLPCEGGWGSFSFYWPWVHNITAGGIPHAYGSGVGVNYQREHLQWLDADMPKRNG